MTTSHAKTLLLSLLAAPALTACNPPQSAAPTQDGTVQQDAPSALPPIGPYTQALADGQLTVKLTFGERTIDMTNPSDEDSLFLADALKSPEQYNAIPVEIGSRDGTLHACTTTANTNGDLEILRTVIIESIINQERMAAECDVIYAIKTAPERAEPAPPPVDPNKIAALNPYPNRTVSAQIHFGPLAQSARVKNA